MNPQTLHVRSTLCSCYSN